MLKQNVPGAGLELPDSACSGHGITEEFYVANGW